MGGSGSGGRDGEEGRANRCVRTLFPFLTPSFILRRILEYTHVSNPASES